MKIKAELIQASNNMSTNVAIFTFKFTYPRRSWLLEVLGIEKYFERWLTKTQYVTDLFKSRAAIDFLKARASAQVLLEEQVTEAAQFSNKIFHALNSCQTITGADIKQAIDLFGPRLQDVLKQYKPGEAHWPCTLSVNHAYTATETGWKPYGLTA